MPVVNETYDADDIPNDLKCDVCNNLINDPQILSCGHTFCKKPCLIANQQTTTIKCIHCHFEMPASEMMLNEQTANQLRLYKMNKNAAIITALCSACRKIDSTVTFCVHCNEKLCTDCQKSHAKQIFTFLMTELVLLQEKYNSLGLYKLSIQTSLTNKSTVVVDLQKQLDHSSNILHNACIKSLTKSQLYLNQLYTNNELFLVTNKQKVTQLGVEFNELKTQLLLDQNNQLEPVALKTILLTVQQLKTKKKNIQKNLLTSNTYEIKSLAISKIFGTIGSQLKGFNLLMPAKLSFANSQSQCYAPSSVHNNSIDESMQLNDSKAQLKEKLDGVNENQTGKKMPNTNITKVIQLNNYKSLQNNEGSSVQKEQNDSKTPTSPSSQNIRRNNHRNRRHNRRFLVKSNQNDSKRPTSPSSQIIQLNNHKPLQENGRSSIKKEQNCSKRSISPWFRNMQLNDSKTQLKEKLDGVNENQTGKKMPNTNITKVQDSLSVDLSRNTGTRIFVGYLNVDITDEEFGSYFSKFGTIVSREIIYHKETGKSRGFGFITFNSVDGVNAVMQTADHYLRNRRVNVKLAKKRNTDKSPNNMNTNFLNKSTNQNTGVSTDYTGRKTPNERQTFQSIQSGRKMSPVRLQTQPCPESSNYLTRPNNMNTIFLNKSTIQNTGVSTDYTGRKTPNERQTFQSIQSGRKMSPVRLQTQPCPESSNYVTRDINLQSRIKRPISTTTSYSSTQFNTNLDSVASHNKGSLKSNRICQIS